MHRIVELADIGQQYKRIDYEYDLISGNVKKVSYQTGEPDQFHHRYWYDADNRITHVETSDDNINWQQDAKYFYYKHGPLARVELGNDKVQALDYAYTLQGWLKGVNSDALDPSLDIGKDGDIASANPNQFVGDDQFGFSLGYYQGDYTPVGGTSAQFLSNMASSTFETAQVGLYNGNISHMVNSSRHVNNQSNVISMGFAYQYDQLNRLRNMVSYEGLTHSTNSWSGSDVQKASSSYTYDKNGNLKSLNRNNRSSAPFDLFTYNFVDNDNNNKLLSVTDAHTDPLTESTDIDNIAGPYTYDQIGNLISDPSEDIANIAWTASGKVRSVTRTTGLNDSDLYFKYDPTGNRIVKMVENPENNSSSLAFYTKTYYLRDAQGNIMATYEREYLSTDPDVLMTFSLTERPVYGSSRIANLVEPVLLVSFDETINSNPVSHSSPDILSHTNGYKHFELTNHLGNVMAVVSDKRTPVITGSAITGYTPELLIAKDYYPFGMEMSGRYTGVGNEDPDNKYRFGFQNQEKDDEWTGQTGSHLNYKYRMYDARIGRFFAIDPLAAKFPYWSPYQFSGNRVIDKIEFEGLQTQPPRYAYSNQSPKLTTGQITKYYYAPPPLRQIQYEAKEGYLKVAEELPSRTTGGQTNQSNNLNFQKLSLIGNGWSNLQEYSDKMNELSKFKSIEVSQIHYNKTNESFYSVVFEFVDPSIEMKFNESQKAWEQEYQRELSMLVKPERKSFDSDADYTKAWWDYKYQVSGIEVRIGPSPKAKLNSLILDNLYLFESETIPMDEIKQTPSY